MKFVVWKKETQNYLSQYNTAMPFAQMFANMKLAQMRFVSLVFLADLVMTERAIQTLSSVKLFLGRITYKPLY